jgi:hypothetical protein
MAKYQYPFGGVNGNWSFLSKHFWGYQKNSQSLSTEAHCPIKRFPDVISEIDKWGARHAEDFAKIQSATGIPAGTGCGSVGLAGENNVELAIGFVSSVNLSLEILILNYGKTSWIL